MTEAATFNPDVLKRFADLMANGRLAHAYLFIGPEYVGKTQTALAVAKLVNCEAPRGGMPCGRCSSCLKISNGNHPDIHLLKVEDEETALKIDQIRTMLERIQLRAFEARTKVFIIKDIERMTTEAGNALLKTLEEPAKNSLLILTTAVPEANLETIRSRCHAVRFFPSTNAALARQLTNMEGTSPQTADCLAAFAEGCLGKALRLKGNRFFERKNDIIDRFIHASESDEFIKKLLGDRERTKEALDVLNTFTRDLLLLKMGVPQEKLVHRDRIDDLQRLDSRYRFEDLADINRLIVKTTQSFRDNLNIRMSLSLIKEYLWGN